MYEQTGNDGSSFPDVLLPASHFLIHLMVSIAVFP